MASGTSALFNNTTGDSNLALGAQSLVHNTTGDDNVASGVLALSQNTTGHDNAGFGVDALDLNTTGNANIALGSGAGESLTTGSKNIDIGNAGRAGEVGTIRIGNKGDQTRAFLAGVSGKAVGGTAQPVLVNAQGQLGTASAKGKAVPGETSAVARLRAQNRRQATQIARLTRDVARQGGELRRLRAGG